jgi:hypothetical protein
MIQWHLVGKSPKKTKLLVARNEYDCVPNIDWKMRFACISGRNSSL